MSHQKTHHFRPPLYHRQESAAAGSGQVRTAAGSATSHANDSDRQGWEAYRRWLARTGEKPSAERAPLDPSIYSWKGYQNWADKVRQNWEPDDQQ